MNFKVGDRVRVVRQFAGNTYIIGKIGTVKIFDDNGNVGIEFDEYIYGHDLRVWGKCKYGYGWYCPDDILEPVHDNSKIVITTDGKTTTAKMYDGKEFVKSAKAVCSPEDRFDFDVGAGIAISRLLDWEFVPAEKETFYNGKVVCIDNRLNKTIYTIGKIYKFENGVMTCDDGYTRSRPFHSFEEFAKNTVSKFIEVVE